MKLTSVLVPMFLFLGLSACDSQPPVVEERLAFDELLAAAPSAGPASAVVVDPLVFPDRDMSCMEDVTRSQFTDVDVEAAITQFAAAVGKFRECDPLRLHFTVDGRVKDDPTGYQPVTVHLGMIASHLRGVEGTFNALPVFTRRQLLHSGMPYVAEYVVEYIHRDHLNEWLLTLEWDRDIATVNPNWFMNPVYKGGERPCDEGSISACWPEDRLEKVELEGYHEPISQADLWIRMFWLRRGEAIFQSAKESVMATFGPRR